MQDVTINF